MTLFQEWMLKRIFRQLVQQDRHQHQIRRIYQLVRESCNDRFFEDNDATMDGFLEDQFRATQSNSKPAVPVIGIGD